MDHNTDKQIETLVDKMMKESTIEQPSFDFTNSVMSQVEALSKSKSLVYKPLISKKIWVLVSVGFIALVLFSIFGTLPESKGWFDTLGFNTNSIHKLFNAIPTFKLPKTTFYALIMLSVMIFIQIPVLKHYMNKRFEA
jgi:hypothetical protein